MNEKIATLFFVFISFNLNAQNIPDSSIYSLIQLNFDQFDQDVSGGWRVYDSKEEYFTSALLIEKYLNYHNDLSPQQEIVLHFHAGQMYAFARQNDKAILQFEQSLNNVENDFMKWNAYVKATIAFLDSDLQGLKLYRDTVATSAFPKNFNKNLIVLDRLIFHFDKNYKEAYTESAPKK